MHIIEQFGREYWTYHGITVLRRREQEKNLHRFERFLERSITTATDQDLKNFLVSLLEDDGLSPGMVNKIRGMLTPFFGWAVGAGHVPADVGALIKLVSSPRAKEIPKLPRPYSRAELDEFYAALDRRYPRASEITLTRWRNGRAGYKRVARHGMRLQIEAQVGLALYCGLRRAEIRDIDIVDIVPENEYIVVRDGKDSPEAIPLPYPEQLRKAIGAWLSWRAELGPSHDRPWLSLQTQSCDGPSTPMHPGRFNNLLTTIEGSFNWHRFRHTCGTEWLRAGMPIEKVQKLLRHKDIAMTLRYGQVANQDVRRSMLRAESHFVAAVAPREREAIAA